jgi:hypothetical protein
MSVPNVFGAHAFWGVGVTSSCFIAFVAVGWEGFVLMLVEFFLLVIWLFCL